jgi:hypothetical protein
MDWRPVYSWQFSVRSFGEEEEKASAETQRTLRLTEKTSRVSQSAHAHTPRVGHPAGNVTVYVCVAPTALDGFWEAIPALARWAMVCRAYGAGRAVPMGWRQFTVGSFRFAVSEKRVKS